MRRLQKLRTLTAYLGNFTAPSYPGIAPKCVVDQENATGLLSRASGDQILIAIPEVREYGESTDTFGDSLSTAFFVVCKVNGPARTQESADAAYRRMLDISQDIIERICSDVTGGDEGEPCQLLAGMRLTGVDVVPEYSIFGGWSGYSVELTLE